MIGEYYQLYKALKETGLFGEDRGGRLNLNQTRFYYDLDFKSFGILDEGWFYMCKFEYVLDKSPREIQTELLFHLDIFT
jgi:hypothetical protein